MPTFDSPTDLMIAKLATRCALSDTDKAALHALPCVTRRVPAQAYMGRDGFQPTRCAFILSGFAVRHKLTADGGRQIISFLIPGDFTDLQQLLLKRADHNVQSLTRLEFAEIAIPDLRAAARSHPNIAEALWIDGLIEASITRETVLNIGRRDATGRLAHLLCEFKSRLALIGEVSDGYDLPMTQEQLGDATGLTSVHINRTLRQLETEGLIGREKRTLRILDWTGLRHRADFNPRYLHLDQIGVQD